VIRLKTRGENDDWNFGTLKNEEEKPPVSEEVPEPKAVTALIEMFKPLELVTPQSAPAILQSAVPQSASVKVQYEQVDDISPKVGEIKELLFKHEELPQIKKILPEEIDVNNANHSLILLREEG
jgi:hypothetical protein